FWLRIAVVFYGVGLVYSFLGLERRSAWLERIIMPSVWLATTLHLVSLVEAAFAAGDLAPSTIHQSESLLAFLCMTAFLAVWTKYRTTSFGIFVFPVAFLLTFAAALGQHPYAFATPLLRRSWIIVHVTLIFAGYAALFLSFVASLVYL